MPPPARTTLEREQDLPVIMQYYLQGYTQHEIADKMGALRSYSLSQMTISNDIKAVRKKWRESSIVDFDEMRQRQLAAIELVERNAWESYELSKGSKEATHVKGEVKVVDGKPRQMPPSEYEKKSQSQSGDPRWMGVILDCIEKKIKLFGLQAPAQVEHNVAVGIAVVDLREQIREKYGVEDERVIDMVIENLKRGEG